MFTRIHLVLLLLALVVIAGGLYWPQEQREAFSGSEAPVEVSLLQPVVPIVPENALDEQDSSAEVTRIVVDQSLQGAHWNDEALDTKVVADDQVVPSPDML